MSRTESRVFHGCSTTAVRTPASRPFHAFRCVDPLWRAAYSAAAESGHTLHNKRRHPPAAIQMRWPANLRSRRSSPEDASNHPSADSAQCALHSPSRKASIGWVRKAPTLVFMGTFKTHAAVVPGGCTKLLQAPDVSWNAPFKAKLRELYDNCMVHGDRQETAGGNPKPPPHDVYLQWIVDAWKSIPREALAASFKICGITTATDGSEDDLIHYIKPDGPIPSGHAALEEARILDGSALEEALLLDDEDAALLNVSGSDDGDDSDSDASIENESSTEADPSQDHTSMTRASKADGCTYAPDCQ